jgi:glycosyltransferase involved in cell wall biosynthesis
MLRISFKVALASNGTMSRRIDGYQRLREPVRRICFLRSAMPLIAWSAMTTKADRQATSTTVNADSRKGEQSNPLVSVGLPTFNRSTSLGRAIQSVLEQHYSNIELIISDNASTDGTQALCEDFLAKDKRIRYVRQSLNMGMTANFRAALAHATGDYFMWLSDDDSLEPSYISRCLEVLSARADVSLVCGAAQYYENKIPSHQGARIVLEQPAPIDRVVAYYQQVNDNGTFYGLIRTQTLEDLTLLNVLGGDWLLIASLAYRGKVITLDDVFVRRSSRGASANVRGLAKSLGISKHETRQPHLVIARNVARDIIVGSPAFAKLALLDRIGLAARSAAIVCKRFVVLENPLQTLVRRIGTRLRRTLTAV